jgi:hypothetical protein
VNAQGSRPKQLTTGKDEMTNYRCALQTELHLIMWITLPVAL